MNKHKALFPISVDSKRFGTTETITALNSISPIYQEITFLIADGLQLYNKATQIEDGKTLKNIIETFNLRNEYHSEREKWLHNLKSKVATSIAGVDWKIKNIYTISDNVFHDIYRNVVISYLTIKEFGEDVRQSAIKHRTKISKDYSTLDFDLSIGYILEEIAINLRLHVIEEIYTEFYIGELPKPLLKLYENKYEIDVFTLCGRKKKNDLTFIFFHSSVDEPFTIWIPAVSE